MHSSDHQLRRLLTTDESSQELIPITRHVEACTHCQSRLEKLNGHGAWTHQLVDLLRSTGQEALEELTTGAFERGTATINMTVVLDQPGDSEAADIEFDPVPLDFLAEPTHPELLGRLGRYDIERVIGAGGMGLVLKGYDGELHRPVAIKVLAPHLAHSAAARKRFAREAQATAAVIHPHVIPIHNVETGDKLPYLVMSYINGPSLQSYVDDQGPLSIEQTLRIAQQTAAGLTAAHQQGLIHRDIKPANILLEEGTQRVVLSDFGLARTVDDASLTRTGIVTGTPHYMSPEQAGGDTIDCRSDLFSLGCVLWFMLTGRPPFRAATAMGVLNRICHEPHRNIRDINGQVPVPLARTIDRLLSKEASGRFTSASEVELELARILQALQSGQLRIRPQRSLLNGLKKKWKPVIAAASLCLLAGIFAALLTMTPWWKQPSSRVADAQADTSPSRVESAALSMGMNSSDWYRSASELEIEMALFDFAPHPARTWEWLYQKSFTSENDIRMLEAELQYLEQTEAIWQYQLQTHSKDPN